MTYEVVKDLFTLGCFLWSELKKKKVMLVCNLVRQCCGVYVAIGNKEII